VFACDLSNGLTRNLTSGAPRLSLDHTAEQCWLVQAESYVIIQDGTNSPLILEGMSLRMSDSDRNEVPPGTVMAYGHGRLFVATGPRAILAGNAFDPSRPEAILEFTETDDLELGGSLWPGSDIGNITAMSFLSNVDTSTGSGPLIVSGVFGLVSMRIDVPREEWQNIVFRKFLVGETGVTGPWASTDMNSDTLFWSREGLRSLSVLLSEVTNARRFVNLSKEVARLYDADDYDLMNRVSLTVDNGRLLFTVGSMRLPFTRPGYDDVEEDTGFWGVVSLDFDHLRGKAFQGQYASTVSFDGVWTGPRFLQLLGRHDRTCFFAKDDTRTGYRNALYRIDYREHLQGYDDGTPIECRLVSRGFVGDMEPDYNPAPFTRKNFESLAVWLRDVEDDISLSAALSVDDNPLYHHLAGSIVHAPTVEWDEGTTETPRAGEAHSLPGTRLATAEFTADPASGASSRAGYTFQFCLDWSGKLAFSRVLLIAGRDPRVSSDPTCLARERNLNAGAELFNPFDSLWDKYRGDISWYDRDLIDMVPAVAAVDADEGTFPYLLMRTEYQAGSEFTTGDRLIQEVPFTGARLTPAKRAAIDYNLLTADQIQMLIDSDKNLIISNPAEKKIFKFDGTSDTVLETYTHPEAFPGYALVRGPDSLISMIFTSDAVGILPGAGSHIVFHDGNDLDGWDSTIPAPGTYAASFGMYNGNLAVGDRTENKVYFYDGTDVDYTFEPDLPNGATYLSGLAFLDDRMYLTFWGHGRLVVYRNTGGDDWEFESALVLPAIVASGFYTGLDILERELLGL